MGNTIKRYLPEEVPDNLFTRNELQLMGLVPLNVKEPDAIVDYSEQNRGFNLYILDKTRQPKKQKSNGIRLTVTDMSVQEILAKRERYIKQRPSMYGNDKR